MFNRKLLNMVQLLVLLVVIVICCLSNVNANNMHALTEDQHNIYQCPEPSTARKLLCQKNVEKSAKLLDYDKETVDCPETGINTDKITCIIVTNLLGDKGGYANIVSGGINDYKVEIFLKSQFGKGLNYHIEIYTGA